MLQILLSILIFAQPQPWAFSFNKDSFTKQSTGFFTRFDEVESIAYITTEEPFEVDSPIKPMLVMENLQTRLYMVFDYNGPAMIVQYALLSNCKGQTIMFQGDHLWHSEIVNTSPFTTHQYTSFTLSNNALLMEIMKEPKVIVRFRADGRDYDVEVPEQIKKAFIKCFNNISE